MDGFSIKYPTKIYIAIKTKNEKKCQKIENFLKYFPWLDILIWDSAFVL